MELRVGSRLKSAVDTTEIVVVKAPRTNIDIRCGGWSMVALTQDAVAVAGSVDPNYCSGSLVGKRYVDERLGVELLCTKGGQGSLAVGETPLTIKPAKPLPSSD